MPLQVLLDGFALFAISMLVHVLAWRLADVQKEIFWLLAIFIALPLLAMSGYVFYGVFDLITGCAIVFLHLSLAVVYIQTYPALREQIPSIRILTLIRSKPAGMTREEVIRQLGNVGFLDSKITDLGKDSLVFQTGDKLHLTPAGKFLAAVFSTYRRLLGSTSAHG